MKQTGKKMIEAKSLCKSYGSRMAIDEVSFHIKSGEIVGFLGPNGAGKTTTMKILTGYMAPNKGEVELNGLNVSQFPLQTKKKFGYLPEIPPLYPDMYVEEFLKYAALLKQCNRKQIPDLIQSAMKKTGLTSVRCRLIKNLSRGFKQRVGLAQALVSDPKILILDEPTVGLDPRQVVEIRDLLKSLKGQHTIILSTHILPEVQISCDRVIIINQGKIITEESLSSLDKKMSTKRQILLKVRKPSSTLKANLKSIPSVLEVKEKADSFLEVNVSSEQDVNEKIAETVVNGGFGLLEMKESGFNLEDVFIRLTDDSSSEKEKTTSENTSQTSEKKGDS